MVADLITIHDQDGLRHFRASRVTVDGIESRVGEEVPRAAISLHADGDRAAQWRCRPFLVDEARWLSSGTIHEVGCACSSTWSKCYG